MSLLGRESPDERDATLGGSRSGPARKEVNVYIPQFITKRPFYAIDEAGEDEAAAEAADEAAVAAAAVTRTGSRDYLSHQRLRQGASEDDNKWYQRGKKAGPAATKYRKGACENCGAMGHGRRDCLSRPRAKLAKYSGQDIEADEIVEDVQLSWDAKRDPWKGFDPSTYSALVARREKMEAARRLLLEKGEGGGGGGGDGDPAAGSTALTTTSTTAATTTKEDTRYAEDADMGVSRTNGAADLRMREDTARYLINLDPDSAQYDPKRRKIVSGGAYLDESAQLFAEQNFAKASGDAESFEKAERYAWEVHDKTGDASLHLQANPTAAAHRRKLEQEAADKMRREMEALMREKYGVTTGLGDDGDDGAEDNTGDAKQTQAKTKTKTKALPTVTASEHFVEYDESGHVKETIQPKRAAASKYAEDVFPLNHTSVWGSWWHNFQWGYACCHSFVRNSYCTGEEGKRAWERAERQRLGDWGDGGDGSGDGGDGGEDEVDGGQQKLLTAHGEDDGSGTADAPADDSARRKKKKDRTARRERED